MSKLDPIRIIDLAPKLGDVIQLWLDENGHPSIKKDKICTALPSTIIAYEAEDKYNSYLLAWKKDEEPVSTVSVGIRHIPNLGGKRLVLDNYLTNYVKMTWADNDYLVTPGAVMPGVVDAPLPKVMTPVIPVITEVPFDFQTYNYGKRK